MVATLAAALLLLAVLAGCGPARSPAGAVAPTATVTGYIQPCAGLPFPLRTSTGARLFSAAATVEALRGHEHQRPIGEGVSHTVFPTAIAARERVSQNQKFRFDHLASGPYVIWGPVRGGQCDYVPGRVRRRRPDRQCRSSEYVQVASAAVRPSRQYDIWSDVLGDHPTPGASHGG